MVNAAETDRHLLVTIRHSSRWFHHSSLVARHSSVRRLVHGPLDPCLVTRRDEFISRQFIGSSRATRRFASLVSSDV